MGCVQSLFNPSKSRSPSPEKEFVPPTFETVVVTRQPQKSSKAADQQQEQSSGRAARGKDNEDDNEDEDDDDDADIVSKCEDFERYALDENADGGSVHYVEATAVRTLAANTGSVAILGTTAKCKSAGSSPAVHAPLAADNRQQTWSPSTSASTPLQRQDSSSCKSQPQLETRYVEATAVRTLAAETGSIAILGTTADPRPRQTASRAGEKKLPEDDAASVHYVEATAVRHLAAETGSIAILASTAAVATNGGPAQPRPSSQSSQSQAEQLYDRAAGRDLDPDRMPVGVREVLDSEPGAPVVATDLPEPENSAASGLLPDDDDPQIPLPVIYAMEMKPEVEEIFKTMQSSASVSYPSETRVVDVSTPRSTTVDGGTPVVVSSESSTRKPLLRQSNKTSEQRENDDVTDTWLPCKIPVVFAKCPPAKSKSLPSGNPALTREPAETGDDKNDRQQHGIVRGSSLPHDTNISRAVPFVNSTKRTDEETVVEPTLDRPASVNKSVTEPTVADSVAKEPAVEKPVMVETVITETTVVEPATAIEPTVVKPVEIETKVEKSDAVKPTVVEKVMDESEATINVTVIEPIVDEPATVKSAEKKPTVNEPVEIRPEVNETNVTGPIAVTKPAVAKPMVNEPDVIKPVITEPAMIETNVTGAIAATEPAADKLVVNEPDVIKPTVVEPVVTKPVITEPVVTKPVITEPAVTKPVIIEPTVAIKPTTVQSKIENENAKMADEGKSIAADGIVIGDKTVATDGEKPEDEKKVLQQADVDSPIVNGYGQKSEDHNETSGPMVNGEPGPDDADDEYRLTMIQSVREAVNRICEQAVEKTEAIVKSGRGRYRPSGNSRKKRDADDSEAADCASSEFSLPPPPPASDPASMAQESSWPPPPPLSEAEEERTIAPGFSFDLPDPPTEMDQLDSEVDKLDISDEEMRATGLPSDDDEKTDTEIIGR